MEKRINRAFRIQLLNWFSRNGRDLPWRRNRTPYRVWVSELMLQQTRVDQVLPYYRRFMRSYSSLNRLAASSQRDVLKHWEGLGYYGRARRMHQTARDLVRAHRGRFPTTYDGLLALPGVGPYTAAAIGSLAMGLDVAVVDGNVTRVLSRVFALSGDMSSSKSKRQVQQLSDTLLPVGKAGPFNEALMELGATVCTPIAPECPKCPLRRICRALEDGAQERYPQKTKRKRRPHKIVGAGVIRNRQGKILIARRNETAMLGGLWEFPGGTQEAGESMQECIERELKEELGISVEVKSQLTIVKHAYSHFTIELHAHWGRIIKGRPRAIECSDYAWVTPDEMRNYPFSRADLHIIEKLSDE